MAELNKPEFYEGREKEERALAASGINADVRAIHTEMAERYAALRLQAVDAQSRRRVCAAGERELLAS